MKFRSILIILGIVFFASGSFINLFFSSNLLWGEMEASLFAPSIESRSLELDCPLMIAPWENATIHANFLNITDKFTKPQVNAYISTASGEPRLETQTLELDSLESASLQWTVDSSDVIFDRLILLSIVQRPYRDLEARQGTCSIYVYSLFGMNGKNSLLTVLEVGVLLSIAGIGLLHYLFFNSEGRIKRIVHVNIFFLVMVLLGVVTAVQRLWGLTLFINAGALLAITVGYIEVLFSKKIVP